MGGMHHISESIVKLELVKLRARIASELACKYLSGHSSTTNWESILMLSNSLADKIVEHAKKKEGMGA